MCRSASPFWRSASTTSKPYENKKIIGASYSHADILKFESLYVRLPCLYIPAHSYPCSSSASGPNSRPRTPPSAGHSRESSVQPGRNSSHTSPPPLRNTYTNFLRTTNHDWEDDDIEEGDIMFEDDEDEFGLPSIASMRRKGRRKEGQRRDTAKGKDPGGTAAKNGLGSTPWRAIDSGDIAEERGIPNYPTAKKTEGKILRPQYQEILRDPANSLHLISHPAVAPNASAKEMEQASIEPAVSLLLLQVSAEDVGAAPDVLLAQEA